ncbi:MAG TPA: hypothetical protein VFN96_06590, partial [Gemmatimonadales bacterium]|nr:hypothetical protein [Gemmatimonadales bacterium]
MQLLTTNDYDDQGRLTSSETQDVTTGTLVRTHVVHHYDALGRDTLSSNGGGGWITTRYDAAGNVIFLRRGPNDSMAVTMEYDELNRLVKRRTPARAYAQSCAPPSCWKPAPLYPNSGTGLLIPVDSAMFSYDAVGNLLTAASRYAKVTRTWAPNGALLSDELNYASYGGSGFSYSAPYPLTFQYDSVGRRVVLGFPSGVGGGTQTYAYDPATGALKTVTDRSGNRFEYTDDAMGRLRFLRTYTPGNVNGVTQEWTYDPDSRVVTRTFASASGVGSADGTRRYDAR